jgi:cephalosporin hydroxylase
MKKLIIDFEKGSVTLEDSRQRCNTYSVGTPEAFFAISQAWLRSGWETKYVYSFTWLGRPIIQLPEDIVRMQEVVFSLQPDVIIETGVAHGGSLVFYASLCKAMDKGRVVGVDIEIRPHNRKAIESHFLFPFITLIEGDSISPQVVSKVRQQIKLGEKVLVLLDSCHTKAHVLGELKAYAPLVSPGSYIVAMDGIMEQLTGAPRTQPDWIWNNPRQAALEFVAANPDFEIEEPPFLFNEGCVKNRVTYWPDAYIRRK